MRVLYVTSSEIWGGQEEYLVQLIEGLRRRLGEEYAPVMVSTRHGVATEMFRQRLPAVPLHTVGLRYRDLWAAFRRISELLREERVELIHVNGRRPVLVSAWFRLLKRVPVIATIHLPFFSQEEAFAKSALLALLHLPPAHLCDLTICVSAQIARERRRYHLMPWSRLRVVHNGVALERFQLDENEVQERRRRVREEHGIAPDDLLIVSLARLEAHKGQDVLIRQLPLLRAQCPRVRLLLVGTGSQAENLVALARRTGVEAQVAFAGFRAEVASYLLASDIFALPSLNEGLPLALLEAMAAGLPVVVTRVGAMGEVVRDGVEGFLLNPGEREQVVDRLARLTVDSELRGHMAQAGRRRVAEQFSLDNMVAETARVYDEVLTTYGRRRIRAG
jgi:glycosyltransferase involved in cell wall biosynthesis